MTNHLHLSDYCKFLGNFRVLLEGNLEEVGKTCGRWGKYSIIIIIFARLVAHYTDPLL